jgi:hypothetical protein
MRSSSLGSDDNLWSRRQAIGGLGIACLATIATAQSKIVAHEFDSEKSSDKPPSPWRCEFEVGRFRIFSSVDESVVRPCVETLPELIAEIHETLQIELPHSEVRMVVLRDRREYDEYISLHFPQLPRRRALFVQHRGPGLIMTYVHDDWLTDVRHESTHALLHHARTKLPSWLDEGLAEFFELKTNNRSRHREHSKALELQLRYGQVPSIEQLEQWHITESLEAIQYREAWSTVAFLLLSSRDTRMALQQYVMDLQSGAAAGYLSRRLPKESRQLWRENFMAFFR